MSKKTVVILSQPRTGCHLLGGYLHANGFKFLDEIFHWLRIKHGKAPLDNIDKFVTWSRDRVVRHLKPEHHGVAIIIDRLQLKSIAKQFNLSEFQELQFLINTFDNPVFISTLRQDIVAQVISFIFAKHDGIWMSSQEKNRKINEPPPFDYYEIIRDMQLPYTDWCWGSFAGELGSMCVLYEHLSKYPNWVLNQLSDHIGHSLEHKEQNMFKRQSNNCKSEYIDLFKSMRAERLKNTYIEAEEHG